MKEIKLDFNDILIVPQEQTTIHTRSIILSKYNDGMLPLITAPMDTVINGNNVNVFTENKINTCYPRNTGIQDNRSFNSYSIDQMGDLLIHDKIWEHGKYLIDVANGHMSRLLGMTKFFKQKYPNTILMVGNVANPETYKLLSDAGVGYPMASLIKECYDISTTLDKPAFIVADGGMQSYSDIIKALALGADYVMLGNILNKALESAGDNYLWKKVRVNQRVAEFAYKIGIPVYKKFRGMSTKEVQLKWGAKKPKTSEGVVRFRRVEYTIPQWIENFDHYLKSAMSYTNSYNLAGFIGNVDVIRITDNAFKRFNK